MRAAISKHVTCHSGGHFCSLSPLALPPPSPPDIVFPFIHSPTSTIAPSRQSRLPAPPFIRNLERMDYSVQHTLDLSTVNPPLDISYMTIIYK